MNCYRFDSTLICGGEPQEIVAHRTSFNAFVLVGNWAAVLIYAFGGTLWRMNTPHALDPPRALIPVDAAAAALGIGVKRFKTAVDAKQMGLMRLMQIGNTCYVRRGHLDTFVAGTVDPLPFSN